MQQAMGDDIERARRQVGSGRTLEEHHARLDYARLAGEQATEQTRSLAVDAYQALHALITEHAAILESMDVISTDDDTFSILRTMEQIKMKWRV